MTNNLSSQSVDKFKLGLVTYSIELESDIRKCACVATTLDNYLKLALSFILVQLIWSTCFCTTGF